MILAFPGHLAIPSLCVCVGGGVKDNLKHSRGSRFQIIKSLWLYQEHIIYKDIEYIHYVVQIETHCNRDNQNRHKGDTQNTACNQYLHCLKS